MLEAPREGVIQIDGVDGDAVHPDTGTTAVPIGGWAGRALVCTSKTMHQGCIDYVRLRPTNKDGNDFVPPPSTEEIQAAHDEMNRAFGASCIELTAHIAEITLDIPGLDREITKTIAQPAIAEIGSALSAVGLRHDGCMLVVLHDAVHPKGISFAREPVAMPSPESGVVLDRITLDNNRSLGHEIGHQLLGHASEGEDQHESDPLNLMAPSDRNGKPSGATGHALTDSQRMLMLTSPWLHPRTVNYYIAYGA